MADVLNDELPRFMRRCAAKRYTCGEHDYALVLADWLIRAMRLEQDPAKDWRGRYHAPHECESLLAVAGWPWPVLASRIIRRLGLRQTADPLTGDIGILRIDDGQKESPMGAIRSGAGWFLLTLDGVVWTSAPLHVMAAWRVPC